MARRPLPPLEAAALLDRASDDLRWYFQDAHALQGGLRSSQSNVETRLLLQGAQTPRASHHFDFRRLAYVRRARKIGHRLAAIDRKHRDVLRFCYERRQVPPFGVLTGLAAERFQDESLIDYAMVYASGYPAKRVRKRIERIISLCRKEYDAALAAYREAP